MSFVTNILLIYYRGRKFEKEITLDYLTKLNNGYDQFSQEMSKKTIVFQVDWNTFLNTEELWNNYIIPEFKKSKQPRLISVPN